jgi:hypothetical protein
VRSILERFNGTLSISSTPLPKIKYKPLETILQNASKHPKWGTAFKRVLRLRGWFAEPQPTEFSGVLRLRRWFRVLRLRIYKILFPFDKFSSFQSG